MRVTLLGTGTSTGVPSLACDCRVCTSADPRDKRLRCSALVQWQDGTTLLVDSSADCRQQLLRVDLRRLDALLLTHPHADHILGLDDLRVFNFRQQRALRVFGNAETLAQLRRTFWYAFEATQYEEGKPKLDLVPVDAAFDVEGRHVVPLPIVHGNLEILAYRFGPFAYITDALTVPDATIAALQGLEVLVINALREHAHPTHQTLAQSLEVIDRIAPGRALITHVGHWLSAADIDARCPPHVRSAWDGLVLDFPES